MLKFSYFCIKIAITIATTYIISLLFGYNSMSEFPYLLKIVIILSSLKDVYDFETDFIKFKNNLEDNA